MHSHMLKELADVTARPLSTTFVRFMAIKRGSWGLEENKCHFCIFKKGKKQDPGNYRPVNLTPMLGKVMVEQIILGTISKHMKDKEEVGSHQCGFTQGNSCSITLIGLYN